MQVVGAGNPLELSKAPRGWAEPQRHHRTESLQQPKQEGTLHAHFIDGRWGFGEEKSLWLKLHFRGVAGARVKSRAMGPKPVVLTRELHCLLKCQVIKINKNRLPAPSFRIAQNSLGVGLRDEDGPTPRVRVWITESSHPEGELKMGTWVKLGLREPGTSDKHALQFSQRRGKAVRVGNLSLTLMGMGREEVRRKEGEGEPHGPH